MKTLLADLRHPLVYLSSLAMRLFPFWERHGFHVTRNHFYSPIPDTRELKDDIWQRRSSLVGLDLRDDRQLELLRLLSTGYKDEYDASPWLRPNVPASTFISQTDSAVLYAMVRHYQPSRIVEIGSGDSTLVSAKALLRNEEVSGKKGELVAIEPYPNETLRNGFPGLSRVVVKRVEDVDLAEFTDLRENDILFIDSSHVLRIGNDVQYEYLDILPRLSKGVIVHIHDIFMPREYPKQWVLDWKCFWNEQYLVQAFLAFNSAFEILWAGQYMHSKYPDKLQEAFAGYDPQVGDLGSLWIRRTA